MPIFTYTKNTENRNFDVLSLVEYAGCVIEVRTYQATRNMSDTMDYTDFRTVNCTDALVWLGPFNHPHGNKYTPARELEFFEQFVYIDCSNHFSDRDFQYLKAEADATKEGSPLLWANYLAWKAHKEAEANRLLLEQKMEREAREASRLAAEKKDADQKAEVETLLRDYSPTKGTTVTIDGVTGEVFWKGVKKYRGRWRATVGIRDSRGVAHWIDIGKFVPAPEKTRSKRGKKTDTST